MSLYIKNNETISVERKVKKDLYELEIDNDGITIRDRINERAVYIEKEYFEQIIEKWRKYHK